MILILPFLNNPKDLDPSYKMDLDLWDCFGRKKLHLITEEIRYVTQERKQALPKVVDHLKMAEKYGTILIHVNMLKMSFKGIKDNYLLAFPEFYSSFVFLTNNHLNIHTQCT